MRRQLSAVVVYSLPSSCWPANTSHSRNSAFSRPPSAWLMRPVTSACALTARQSGKRGRVSMVVIFSRKAAGSMGANRPERPRLEPMISLMFRPMAGSVVATATNSGTAIGIGWMVPCVTSSLRTAAARREKSPMSAPAAAPAPSTTARRRLSVRLPARDVMMVRRTFCITALIPVPWAAICDLHPGQRLAAEHVARVESDLDVLPLLVMLGSQHVVGLAADDGALGAVASGEVVRAVPAVEHFRRRGEGPVGLEPHAHQHDQLARIGRSSRRRPQPRQPRAQRVELAHRQLRVPTARQSKRGGGTERLGCGRKARRVTLVEQRLDPLRIEFGRG